MKKLEILLVIALVLVSISKTKAQDVLTAKKLVVPDWVNVALGSSNQMEGGHHVYENWGAYLEGIKINTAKTGMLVSILDPDNNPATENPAIYRLAGWTDTGAKPDSLGHASANSEWIRMDNFEAEAMVYSGLTTAALDITNLATLDAAITATTVTGVTAANGIYSSIAPTAAAADQIYHLFIPVSWRNPELLLGADIATGILTLSGEITKDGIVYNHWKSIELGTGVSGDFTVK